MAFRLAAAPPPRWAVARARAWGLHAGPFTAHLRLNGSRPVPVTPPPKPPADSTSPAWCPVLSQHTRMQPRRGPTLGMISAPPFPQSTSRDSSLTLASLLRRRFSDRRAALWAGPTCSIIGTPRHILAKKKQKIISCAIQTSSGVPQRTTTWTCWCLSSMF